MNRRPAPRSSRGIRRGEARIIGAAVELRDREAHPPKSRELLTLAGGEAFGYSLLQRCSRSGVSILMTHEIPELFGATRLSEFGVSHLADNVVVLQYVHSGSSIDRTLAVLKTRASTHDPAVRAFTITRQGIRIADDGSAPGS